MSHPESAVAPRVRSLEAADRTRVEAITRGVGLFREDEIPVALEVFDGILAPWTDPGPRPYSGLAAERDGELVGWIAWGPTPCTQGTYDLYWLVVDPDRHGEGIGTALVSEMEHRLRGAARLIVVETAGRDDYAGTRAFYEALGYQAAARLPDFYAPGDDQVVYLKFFTSVANPQGGR